MISVSDSNIEFQVVEIAWRGKKLGKKCTFWCTHFH